MHQVTVIIATSMKRTDWLINRSLLSVYKQQEINAKYIDILVIDDNRDTDEFEKIKKSITQLRGVLGFNSDEFCTRVLKNMRSKFQSGTGAWNTGIIEAYKNNPTGYISILDDDDEYLSHHLATCISKIKRHTVGVFQSLQWYNTDGTKFRFPLNIDEMKPSFFFVGNPGVQGSNMFIKTTSLVKINMFDENLPNTTDRDLMIRFLSSLSEKDKIYVSDSVTVIHYNHNKPKVNNNLTLKQVGLDLFFMKYRNRFNESEFKASIKRAKSLFNYNAIKFQ